jgi:STE24 endopeptidase
VIARVLLALLLALCAGGSALAGTARPNALDRSVNAIPMATLLSQPATKLLDADREAAAQRLEDYRSPVWIVMVLLEIVLLAWFWRSGWAAMLRGRLRRSIRNEFFVRFCFGAALAAIARLAALLPQFVEYRMWRTMGISTEAFGQWAGAWLVSAFVAMLLAGCVAAIVLWLADRTHQWYLYTIAGVFALTLAVTFVTPFAAGPFFARQISAPASVVASVRQLAMRAHSRVVPVREVLLETRSRAGRTYLTGVGPSEELRLSDTLVAGSTAGELQFALAREVGHIAGRDPLHKALMLALVIILGTAIAVFVADRVGFRRDDDPVSRLALVGALLGCVYLVALPVYSAYERRLELRADRFAVALTHDPASGVRSIVRRADQDLLAPCPNRFSLWYFGTLPPTAKRIAALQGAPDPCP